MVANRNPLENILIIGTVWPEPNSSAAGGRMLQLIDSFLKEGAKITFASSAADSEFMFDVRDLGIEKVTIELNSSTFNSFIQSLNPTLVLFDRFMTEEQYGWRVAKECPEAIRILDTEDLHCLRFARQKALKENRIFKKEDLINDSAKREIASILRCDLSLIISSYEMDLLHNFFKIDSSLLIHAPFQLDPLSEEEITDWIPFEERNHFVFIGNFLHEPNWDAVKYLTKDIWPLIRKKLPQAELHIYGAYPSQKVKDLHNPKEGFLCFGRAESAKSVVSKAKVCIAPLRFGAGLKGKLIEAMQCGTPSVTTDIGAEGMAEDLPWSGNIANSPKEIADAAVELFQNKSTWKTAQSTGISIIEMGYSKKKIHAELIHKIRSVAGNLQNHRTNNFMGSMLMHHTMASTKYMSMWIESKNL